MKIVIALLIGLILGGVFFGGLWLTVKKALVTTYAPLWFLGSIVIRTAVVLAGFYFISKDGIIALFVSVCAFIAARMLVFFITKQLEQKQITLTQSKRL